MTATATRTGELDERVHQRHHPRDHQHRAKHP